MSATAKSSFRVTFASINAVDSGMTVSIRMWPFGVTTGHEARPRVPT